MFYHDQWLNFKGFKLLYKYHNNDQFNHENYKYYKTKLIVNSISIKYLINQYYSIKYAKQKHPMQVKKGKAKSETPVSSYSYTRLKKCDIW